MSSDAMEDPAARRKPIIKLWHKIVASKVLLLSIVLHLVFGVGATVIVVQEIRARRKTTFQGGPPTVNASTRALEHQVSMAKRKSSMSAPAQAKRITTTGLARIALPEMPAMPHATEVIPNRMAGLGGNGNGFGIGGAGGGMGNGNGFSFNLPPMMGDRCSAAARATAMAANGGDPKCEEAILKGLNWLKAHQNADGSWGGQFQCSMTGLALLSYMGHCERPISKDFGPNVRKAIDFLVSTGEGQGGKLSRVGGNPWVYEHGICAYALGESYILTREAKIGEVLKKAMPMIVNGQGADGGWMYEYSKQTPSDTSVTGWQIQALKTALLSDLKLEGVDTAMNKAMGDLERVQNDKGSFGYRDQTESWDLTGVGAFCLQVGRHERGIRVRKALHFAVQDSATAKAIEYKSGDANLYAWYYLTQACFQYGGSYWQKWNKEFQPELLSNQGADGGWPETGASRAELYRGKGGDMDAQVFRTCMCILMLEVYYRYLPSSRA